MSRWVGISREGGDIRLFSTLVPKVCREGGDIGLFITLVPKLFREGGGIALFSVYYVVFGNREPCLWHP